MLEEDEEERKAVGTGLSTFLILPSLSALSGADHSKHTPGAHERARAAPYTCNHNYDDSDFLASHTEICQNYDLHCSVPAIRPIMEGLPWQP